MAEKMTYINPDMLKWARGMSGISLDEANLKYEKDIIKSWEDGTDYPTYAQLKELATIYRKPVAVFFFSKLPFVKDISASCRTLPKEIYSSLSKETIKMFDEARVMQLNLYDLNNNINPCKLKLTDIKFNKPDIKTIAKDLRNAMNVSISIQKKWSKISDAFEYWRDCFYELGIYVFKEAFHDDSVSGFCLYDSEFPVIFVNNSLSFTRQIFTLFHEIYHIIHKTSGVDLLNDSELSIYSNATDYSIEKSCNAFSGEFLVPDDDFSSTMKNVAISDDNIAKWAQQYSVSREVILRKLLDKGKITSNQYDKKQQEFHDDYLRAKEFTKQKDKSGGSYYNTQLAYKGKHYTNLSFSMYYSQKINITQLSQYMNMKIPSIRVIAAQRGWNSL